MNKKEALKILIKNSFIFNENVKEKLISGISSMTPKDIDALGKFLALIKQKNINSKKS